MNITPILLAVTASAAAAARQPPDWAGRAPDGAVLLLAHGYSKTSNHIFGWRSITEDDGRTWGEPALVSDYPGVEPVLVRHEKRLLVFIRGNKTGDDNLQFLAVSDDWGDTWETRPAGIESLLPLPARLAHSFAMVDPQDPGKLLAITFECGKYGETSPQHRDALNLRKFTGWQILLPQSTGAGDGVMQACNCRTPLVTDPAIRVPIPKPARRTR